MSEKKDFHNLSVKVSKTLLKEFNTEIVHKYGKTYGNMNNGIIEAMKLWAKTQKLEREKNAV